MPALMCTTVPPAKSSAPLSEHEAVRAVPDHVRDRQVGEGEPQRAEHQHRAEAHALGEGTDDQRAGDAGEGRLEHHEHVFGQCDTPAVKVAARVSLLTPLRNSLSKLPMNALPPLKASV